MTLFGVTEKGEYKYYCNDCYTITFTDEKNN